MQSLPASLRLCRNYKQSLSTKEAFDQLFNYPNSILLMLDKSIMRLNGLCNCGLGRQAAPTTRKLG